MIAKYMTEVERRQVGDIGEFCHVPFARRRQCDGFLHALQRARPPDLSLGSQGRFTVAHRFERHVEEIEPERLGLEFISLRALQPGPQQVAQHHGPGWQQALRCQGFTVAARELFRRQILAKPQGDGAVADRAGKADPERRIGGKEYGVARRADDMPAGCVMLGKYAADRQCDRVQVLPLDVAARGGCRTGLEQADLQRRAFKQCFTADFQGLDPGILTQVHDGRFLL